MILKFYLRSIILNEGNRLTENQKRAMISTMGYIPYMVGGSGHISLSFVKNRNVYP